MLECIKIKKLSLFMTEDLTLQSTVAVGKVAKCAWKEGQVVLVKQ